MISHHIIPSVKAAQVGPLPELSLAVLTLQNALAELHHLGDLKEKASKARVLRLETMLQVRETCDYAEGVVPAALWTLATYKELLFLDHNHK